MSMLASTFRNAGAWGPRVAMTVNFSFIKTICRYNHHRHYHHHHHHHRRRHRHRLNSSFLAGLLTPIMHGRLHTDTFYIIKKQALLLLSKFNNQTHCKIIILNKICQIFLLVFSFLAVDQSAARGSFSIERKCEPSKLLVRGAPSFESMNRIFKYDHSNDSY